MKKLAIFPNFNQLEQLKKYKEEVYVISKEKRTNDKDENIKYIYADESYSFGIEPINVMCCNEEAIYWLCSRNLPNVKLFFEKEILDMCFKLNAYKILKEKDIECVDKSTKFEGTYPILLKPNFGFASIGVKRIVDMHKLEEYINSFETLIQNSAIKEYQEKYFCGLQNKIIYEEYIDNGIFFSVPFIYDKSNHKVHMFPIKGTSFEKNATTDFQWSGFGYNPKEIEGKILIEMEKMLIKISQSFLLKSSVNMSEMIYDMNTNKLKLLEFSPRVPGGKLSKLIKLCEGIDLDEISIDCFLHERKLEELVNHNSNEMLLILTKGSMEDEAFDGYTLISQDRKMSVSNNEIVYNFLKKCE